MADTHPLILRGREALARADLAAASAAAEERLRDTPRDLEALELRALVQERRGEIVQAAETLKSVLGIDPRAEWAYTSLIQLLITLGRRAEAEKLARLALRLNPLNAQAHNLFGLLLSELNDLPSGEWHFRKALELGGAQARFCANLALNLMQQGRTDEADACYAQADALAPNDFKTLAHWSKLCEVKGDLARAEELLNRAEAASSPKDVDLLRASFLSRKGQHRDALAIIEAAPALSGHALLERGRLFDRLGRYYEAWRDFVAGKKQLAADAGGAEYNSAAVEDFFAHLKRFFVRRNLALLPRADVRRDVPQPIFICGFPRSGTTMVEQMLSSHSAVRAGGELTFIGELRPLANQLFAGGEPFPLNLARSWTADNRYAATLFRDHYFARAGQYGLLAAGKEFFTDKMPFNEIWLPLLRMAFPHARIVHVVRHPLDVCVSVLSNNLTHGFNCGYRIEDIVHHLGAVHELVGHYRREFGADEYLLKYEDFVADQVGQTRRLLEYLGLPFEEGCLRFHENQRYAPTPSYAQVTEKLNDRSINRHRHYTEQLKPFVARLRPIMTAYGYES